MRFEIYRARRGLLTRTQWRWRLRAANGQILANGGEGFNNRADLMRSIASIQRGAAGAPVAEASP